MKPSHRSAALSLPVAVVAGLLAFGLGGCSGDGNLVRDVAVASGVTGSEPRPAPDFVSRTRPASVEYLPVGTPAATRATRAKDKAAVGGAEAEMDALRRRNEARGAVARRASTP